MKLFKIVNYLTIFITIFILNILFNISIIADLPKEKINHLFTTIYIDRNFNDFERGAITSAAKKWSKTTNNIVEYDVIQLPTDKQILFDNSLFFIKISEDSPEIIFGDYASKTNILGYFNPEGYATIALVSGRILQSNYESIVLHELGHSLGLNHLEGFENIDTLMFPYSTIIIGNYTMPSGANHITKKDLDQFCLLYNCENLPK